MRNFKLPQRWRLENVTEDGGLYSAGRRPLIYLILAGFPDPARATALVQTTGTREEFWFKGPLCKRGNQGGKTLSSNVT